MDIITQTPDSVHNMACHVINVVKLVVRVATN